MQQLHESDLQKYVELLKQGAVIIYPTETSYAIGCDATNATAVAQVFALKGRPNGKGTPVIIPRNHDPKIYIHLSTEAEILTKKHWPGALNVIGQRQAQSPISDLCETDGTQSIRKSSSGIADQLATHLDRPLVATSANKSGDQAIYDPEIIKQTFKNTELVTVVDAGALPETPASTTVDCTTKTMKIVRQGGIQI